MRRHPDQDAERDTVTAFSLTAPKNIDGALATMQAFIDALSKVEGIDSLPKASETLWEGRGMGGEFYTPLGMITWDYDDAKTPADGWLETVSPRCAIVYSETVPFLSITHYCEVNYDVSETEAQETIISLIETLDPKALIHHGGEW